MAGGRERLPASKTPRCQSVPRFHRLLIEDAARDDDLTRRVRQRLPGVPVEIIPSREALRGGPHHPPDRFRGKRTLLLARQKGPFRRPCPGTREYVCCGYQVLQVMTNCPMDCSYCVLQGYLNLPAVTVFTNLEDLLRELDQHLQARPGEIHRLGTGEFGDSLALDELLGLHEALIPRFAGQSRALLEIKSKHHGVEHLLPLGPNPQVVFAWSLNPPRLIRQEEHGSSPLAARLEAARQCAAAGFRLAFHFDPLIYVPGWEDDYRRLVAALAAAAPAAAVTWISLGCLRFPPAMKEILRRRTPASRLAEEELVTGLDGKLRYFKGLRIEMYSRLRQWLAPVFPQAAIYLCMESPAVWQAVFGAAPDRMELARRLDARVTP